jgi:hypothetical protein
MVYAHTAHNRSVYASPPLAARATVLLGRSAYGLAPTQNLRHSLSALEMLRISLSGPPNRHIQPERYAKLRLNFFERNYK